MTSREKREKTTGKGDGIGKKEKNKNGATKKLIKSVKKFTIFLPINGKRNGQKTQKVEKIADYSFWKVEINGKENGETEIDRNAGLS